MLVGGMPQAVDAYIETNNLSMVDQMLKTAGNELFYYTFPKETSNHNYEIDFLPADLHGVVFI